MTESMVAISNPGGAAVWSAQHGRVAALFPGGTTYFAALGYLVDLSLCHGGALSAIGLADDTVGHRLVVGELPEEDEYTNPSLCVVFFRR